MKLKRCFIDHRGNIWKDATLIEAAKDIPETVFLISNVSLDEMIRWKIANLRDYVDHHKRVMNADLSIPIILRPDGYPMDGWHRIIKAIGSGRKELTAKRFTAETLPKPDLRNY